MDNQIVNKLAVAEKFFTNPEYQSTVKEAVNAYWAGELIRCSKLLDKLPTAEQLLDALVEKLKGKSVYKTIRHIQEGNGGSRLTNMKAISSLMTHALIEMESGKPEYGLLIPIIYERLGKMVYEL